MGLKPRVEKKEKAVDVKKDLKRTHEIPKNEPPKKREPKVKKETAKALIKKLLLERKFTDEQIAATVLTKYPDTFKKNYISCTRGDINAGRIKVEGQICEHIPVLIENEAGEVVDKTTLPKKEKKTKGKVKKEDDPLSNIAGIDVDTEEPDEDEVVEED